MAEAPGTAASWYELFFDLVFVVVVAISAHIIEVDPGPPTVGIFLLLFFPLWWAWVNVTAVSTINAAAFPALGPLLIVAMPGPAAMAIAIAGGIEHSAWLFAIGAAWTRLVLLVMWLIPRVAGANGAPIWQFLVYNLATALIWLASIIVPQPWQFVLWAIAVATEVALLALRSSMELFGRASVSHFLERVGLFVVIVVGEAVYLSVTALAGHPSIGGGLAALAGLATCALLARVFFEAGVPTAEAGMAAAQAAQSFRAVRDVAMYLPFLLVAGLTLVAAAVGIAVEHAGMPLEPDARLLLFLGVAGFYLSNALVGVRLRRPLAGIALLLFPALALAAAACVVPGIPPWMTLALVALVLAILDIVSGRIWRHHRGHGTPSSAASTPNDEIA